MLSRIIVLVVAGVVVVYIVRFIDNFFLSAQKINSTFKHPAACQHTSANDTGFVFQLVVAMAESLLTRFSEYLRTAVFIGWVI